MTHDCDDCGSDHAGPCDLAGVMARLCPACEESWCRDVALWRTLGLMLKTFGVPIGAFYIKDTA